MAEVESFTLDHNKVIAPYVRLIANEHGKKGDVISNFDIRFLQPNKQEMPTGVVHTFEHLLADLLRDRLTEAPFALAICFTICVNVFPGPTSIKTSTPS